MKPRASLLSADSLLLFDAMPATLEYEGFQPTLLGMAIAFEGEGPGMITDEDEENIFIESEYFTGWMPKMEFYDLLGVED